MYDSDGKRRAREMVVEVAKRGDCKTFLDLWGGGESARMAAAAGLMVTSVDRDDSVREAMFADAADHGYEAFSGNVVKVRGEFDFVFADFCGGANPTRFTEVRALAAKTTKWLAITLSPDHQLDPSMQGESAFYTVPAWVVGATQMRLGFVSRYARNENGTTMWFLILERRPLWDVHRSSSYRNMPEKITVRAGSEYDPTTVARALTTTRPVHSMRYWSSPYFARRFRDMKLRTQQPWKPSVLHKKKCGWCEIEFTTRNASRKFCKHSCQTKKKRYPDRVASTPDECRGCGDPFVRPSARQLYCEKQCQSDFNNLNAAARRGSPGFALVPLVCQRCGTEVQIAGSRAKIQKFCTTQCGRRAGKAAKRRRVAEARRASRIGPPGVVVAA